MVVVHGGVTTPAIRSARAIVNDMTTARSVAIPQNQTHVAQPSHVDQPSNEAKPSRIAQPSRVAHPSHVTHGHEGHIHNMALDLKDDVETKDVAAQEEFPRPSDMRKIDKLSTV